MSDVWVVRCPKGKVIGASTFNDRAIAEAQNGTIKMDSRKALNETWNLCWDDRGEAGTYSCDGFTLTRETLLTPAQSAVIAFAFKHEQNPNLDTARQLHEQVRALRAIEEDA
jgi:hypothetical protein